MNEARYERRPRAQFTTAFLSLLVFGLAIYAFLSSPFFKVSKVRVTGAKVLSSEEVVILTGVTANDNIFRLSASKVAKRVMGSPRIASVSVTKRFPSTLEVRVLERRPVVLIPYSTYYLDVDGLGVPVSMVSDLASSRLPLLTGRPLLAVSLGRAVNDADFREVVTIPASLRDDTLSRLSEIDGDNLNDVVLYTIDGVRIRWGAPEANRRKATILDSILASLDDGSLVSTNIDISSPGTPVISGKLADEKSLDIKGNPPRPLN